MVAWGRFRKLGGIMLAKLAQGEAKPSAWPSRFLA